jgi:alpha-galactosidase
MRWQQIVHAGDLAFDIAIETNTPVSVDVEIESLANLLDTCLIHVHLRTGSGVEFNIESFTVEWMLPAADMHGLYFGGNPMAELSYLPFWERQKYTCANSGVPYLSLIHRNGENRAAFGLLDQITETRLSANLSEITRCYHMQFQKPASGAASRHQIHVTGQHTETLFVSKAQALWPDVLQAYVWEVDAQAQPAHMPVPDHAYDPVFCTWTAVHHAVSHEWIMRNAPVAASLGFRTWITDDGWFIEKGQFGNYAEAGDWQPNTTKFPDFEEHVRAVQRLGFRYVLWVAPFMVGKTSDATSQFAHLLIPGQEREQFDNLSPLCSETGTIIGNLLTRLVDNYNLDGLKIDFLDSIRLQNLHTNSSNEQTLGHGIKTTLQQAVDAIRATKPDFLIEFRNSYANLASRSYANIYRSSDVPINFKLNHWQAVMLRLLAPDRAIHLDPALWHPDDTDENVAVHLINCIVSVPMISIELAQYPESHLQLIRHWIGFYNDHRQTIIHGEFKPVLRLGHIPLIYFRGESELIIGLYDDIDVNVESFPRTTWILNASTRDYIDLSCLRCQGRYLVITRDMYGNITSQRRVIFPQAHIKVQVGGSLEFVAE